MITLRESVLSLYGAGRLARFDASGLRYFSPGVDGAKRSFYAAAVVAPLYVLYVYVQIQSGLIKTPLVRLIPLESVAYAVSWVAYPLAILSFTRALGRDRHVVRYITAYNWSNVLLNALYLGIGMMMMRAGGPAAGGGAFALLATVYMTVFLWFIAKSALGVSGLVAAGAVLIDFTLGLLVQIASAYML
ncbi:hypothetical protein [Varunaivibrio sulfuroxidans]|uniref:Yip1-like protein n=1 Tax=Varunaivibrio sulfuroxidans TaxID=1773489 RepID=A0A4R3JHM7_9PROT|nr:hypothetical protein [Varunaivibrio sulfuroxidans]TCS65015.1 hypothetical protein EDD55_101348 [Varunaivibrio sulfuroxidans]WES29695.1 hypothetical protein P3M64_08525 [Varunaivibrio sulfuroxidans]